METYFQTRGRDLLYHGRSQVEISQHIFKLEKKRNSEHNESTLNDLYHTSLSAIGIARLLGRVSAHDRDEPGGKARRDGP